MAFATMRAEESRKETAAGLRIAVADAFARHSTSTASGARGLHPSRLGDVLKDLDFGRRELKLGRGLSKSTVSVAATASDVAFCLRALGISDADLKCKDTIVSQDAFTAWYIRETLGDAGDNRNRLLVKNVTGKVRATTHRLPPGDFTYGRGSGHNEVPVSELLAFKFAPADVPKVRVSSVDASQTFGGKSGAVEDLPDLLRHREGVDERAALAEPEYADLGGKRTLGRLPAPKDTVTSTLRAAHAKLPAAASSKASVVDETSATKEQWKMACFRDVPPRVPVDGQPLRVSFRVLARSE